MALQTFSNTHVIGIAQACLAASLSISARGSSCAGSRNGTKGKPVKILETRRLILRHLLPEDLDRLFALYSDPEIRRYFPEGMLTYEETQEELEWFLDG